MNIITIKFHPLDIVLHHCFKQYKPTTDLPIWKKHTYIKGLRIYCDCYYITFLLSLKFLILNNILHALFWLLFVTTVMFKCSLIYHCKYLSVVCICCCSLSVHVIFLNVTTTYIVHVHWTKSQPNNITSDFTAHQRNSIYLK